MSEYWPIIAIAIVVVVLVAWKLKAPGGRSRAARSTIARAGFRPCPDETEFLEQTVAALENNRAHRYLVHNPARTTADPPVYYYEKERRRDGSDTDPVAEREILFALERPPRGPLVAAVKPSKLAAGLAAKLIGALATGPWDSQPDDLARIELPRDLKGSNIIALLGEPDASLYDLVDAGTVSALQGIGDAGGLIVRMRGHWCSISSASDHIPFKVDDLVSRVHSLM